MVHWSLEAEIKLFHSLMHFKPVGLDRHFQMICLACRFNDLGGPACSISEIWDHLSELYDLNELNGSEVIPFPTKSKEYTLPDEFSVLKQKAFPRAKAKLVPGSPSQQKRKTGYLYFQLLETFIRIHMI
uniref:MRG/MORF4L-binding protein n=1 Tax=Schistocephalus solidus TaxID=70667 RepID=A0A0X3Q203_SCHSO